MIRSLEISFYRLPIVRMNIKKSKVICTQEDTKYSLERFAVYLETL